MADDEIVARYRWSADIAIMGFEYDLRRKIRPAIRRLAPIIGVGLVVLPPWGYLSGENPAHVLAFIPLGVVWLFKKPLGRWLLRRRLARRSDRNVDVTWRFSADGIRSETSSSSSESEWSLFESWYETPEGFLTYQPSGLMVFIPYSGFSGEQDVATLNAMAREHIKTTGIVK